MAFAELQEQFTSTYVNKRMQAICNMLLTDGLLQPGWEAEIADMQVELEALRYWLGRNEFAAGEVNRQLKQYAAMRTAKEGVL